MGGPEGTADERAISVDSPSSGSLSELSWLQRAKDEFRWTFTKDGLIGDYECVHPSYGGEHVGGELGY